MSENMEKLAEIIPGELAFHTADWLVSAEEGLLVDILFRLLEDGFSVKATIVNGKAKINAIKDR